MRVRRRWIYGLLGVALFLLSFGWVEIAKLADASARAGRGAAGPSEAAVYFESADPVGDDNGFGTYQYPTNLAFQPYHGLFDITGFKVWSEPDLPPGGPADAPLYFDTRFAKITNPWMAPEGFIHQNLRIFVDSVPNQGMLTLPQPGAYVTFNPRYAWDFCLKIVGWGSSQLIKAEQGKLVAYPLKATLLKDGLTIRANVATDLVGTPGSGWHYYVLVGSYDGFGEDFFRKVVKAPGEWVVGGGVADNLEPQVLDVLAPEKGAHNQVSQLRSFDPQTGKLAEVYPTGQDLAAGGLHRMLLWVVLAVLAGLLLIGMGLRKKPRNIAWFWVRIKKDVAAAETPPSAKA